MDSSRLRSRLLPLLRHPALRALAEVAEGRPVHLVGGALRDALLGRESHDLDCLVGGDGDAVIRRLAARLGGRRVALGGERFAAFRLVHEDFELDLWDREEQSLESDLARRDFTVNALALDLRSGELVDPFDGVGDLARRRLRQTRTGVLEEDPLRVLRLARLALSLGGFEPDAATLEAARQAAPGLSQVAAERVQAETTTLLTHPERGRGLALLLRADAFPRLWQVSETPPEGLVRRLEALEPALTAFTEGDLGGAGAPEPGAAAHALLLRALRPPPRTRSLARDLVAEGRLSGGLAKTVTAIAHEAGLPNEKIEARRFVFRLGKRWPTAAALLAAEATDRGEEWTQDGLRLRRVARQGGEDLLSPPRFIDGREVAARFGLAPGPRLGEALRALQMAQVEGRVTHREEAQEFLEEWIRAGGRDRDDSSALRPGESAAPRTDQ